jgi:hypothetical protein
MSERVELSDDQRRGHEDPYLRKISEAQKVECVSIATRSLREGVDAVGPCGRPLEAAPRRTP